MVAQMTNDQAALTNRLVAQMTNEQAALKNRLVIQIMNEHGALKNRLVTQVTTEQAKLENQLAMLKALSPRVTNQEIRRINQNNFEHGRANYSLDPLVKIVEGDGDGLPPHYVVAPGPLPYSIVDVISSACFPVNRGRLDRMTGEDLSILSAHYNDDFSIVEGDSLKIHKSKFLEFFM